MDLSLHQEILMFLDKNNHLKAMKNECLKFLSQQTETTLPKLLPLRYLLHIDLMILLDFSPEAASALVKEPLKWERAASDIFYSCLRSLVPDSEDLYIREQVNIVLQVSRVPSLVVTPNIRSSQGLACFSGLLLSLSTPFSYVLHSVWICPENCDGSELILRELPIVLPKCTMCRCPLHENSASRRCGEKVEAMFQIQNDKQPKKFIVCDEQITKLKHGFLYYLVGVTVKKTITVRFVDPIFPLEVSLASALPSDISKLLRSCKATPWKFIYCLASGLGVNICPIASFMHLKIALLISLASVRANSVNKSQILHVLVSCSDTSYVSSLMIEAAKMAERYVTIGPSSYSSVPTALIGSSRGACVLPLPLHVYSENQVSKVLSALESNEISIDNAKVPLQCTVWAHGMDFKKINFTNIGSIFGFSIRGDQNEYTDDIADFILKNSVEPPVVTKEEKRASKDVITYLDLVAGIDVSLDKKAERILRSYFMAARKEKPKGVSVGSLNALITICLTSARLCRRSCASMEDAVFAIWLHVSGIPEPTFAPPEYLKTSSDVKQIHKNMQDFIEWVERFVGNVIDLD